MKYTYLYTGDTPVRGTWKGKDYCLMPQQEIDLDNQPDPEDPNDHLGTLVATDKLQFKGEGTADAE